MSIAVANKTADSTSTSFKTYTPEPKQAEFHVSEAKYRAMIGAFRSGKTYAACYEVIGLSLRFPGNEGLICRRDYTALRDSTMTTFFDILPKTDPLVLKWNETTHDLWLKTNGKPSKIMFRGADDYHQFGSYELGWFWIDQAEQVRDKVFTMLQSRLSKRGAKLSGIITPNPPNQYHWIYKTFKKAKHPEEYWYIQTSTYDNKKYLPRGYIEDLEKKPENWKKMYLHGEFGFMAEGDPVYSIFRSELNMSKEPLRVIPNLPILRVWDFGYRFPAVGFYQYLEAKDRMHKLAEVVGHQVTLDPFADRVIGFGLERFGNATYKDYCDPKAGEQKSDKSEKTSIEILESKGIGDIRFQQGFVMDGVNLIRRYLIARDDGYPGYIIDPSCQTTEEAYLGGYYLVDERDKPDDKCHPYCDVADDDRYAFVNTVQINKLKLKKKIRKEQPKGFGPTGY